MAHRAIWMAAAVRVDARGRCEPPGRAQSTGPVFCDGRSACDVNPSPAVQIATLSLHMCAASSRSKRWTRRATGSTIYPERGCDTEAYYYSPAELKSASGVALHEKLHALVATPHAVIPYTHTTKTDTWDTLRDLDTDPADPDKVILIYSQRAEPAASQGVASGWNREHLWPQSFGVGASGADTSDLHALRPADWNVNAARGNLPFSWCNKSTPCRDIPAHPEAANSTGKNQNVFMPPTSVRGDVARSLMYMAIRYDGSDENTERLLLGECPCMQTSTMGILSVLLQWHSDDPPSDAELARNDAICRRYQKNRNPFIDMPELAAKAFAEFAQVGGSVTCPPCVSISRDISTSSLKPQTLVVQASSSGASSTTNPLLPLLTPMPRSGAWASSTSLGVVLLVFSGCMLGMWL